MIHIQFTEEDIKNIKLIRQTHPDYRVQRRMEALLLKDYGAPHWLICRFAEISEATLTKELKSFQQHGLSELTHTNYRGQPSKLHEHEGILKELFALSPPASAREAAGEIEKLTGIRRSTTQIRNFLHSIGMKLRKVKAIPAKAEPKKQSDFLRNTLEPSLQEAKEGKRVVLFMDAVHFLYTAFLGVVWCFERLYIKSPSGRKRLNILGCLNAVNHEVLSVTENAYINANSVCRLLEKVAQTYGDSVPITIILDNARYQRCNLVTSCAESLGIELVFLPSYSPNLNLIERYWKWLKKKCLYSKYYCDFSSMSSAVLDRIRTSDPEKIEELNSLLTLRFESFEKIYQ